MRNEGALIARFHAISARSIDLAIGELAARQHGVVSMAQLRALGVHPATVSARAARGSLHRIHRGVYAVGHRSLTLEGRLLAAVLAVGSDAAVSHLSAAVHWELLRPHNGSRQPPVDVLAPRRVKSRAGIRVHPAGVLQRCDLTRRHAVPVTSPARTLIDLAGAVPEHVLRRAVREAQVLRLIDHDAFAGLAATANGRPGVVALRRILAIGPAPTRSELEDRMLDLLERHGFPRPLINARVPGIARRIEADFLWLELGLIVETDGDRYHGSRVARQDDARRQALLEAAGYRVMRFTWRQVVEQERETVQRLRNALRDQARRTGTA